MSMAASGLVSAISEQQQAAAEAEIVEQSKRIEFYLTEYSVEILAAKVHNGDFQVPKYQRAFTWEDDRKSKFIESIVIGLPIPFLFFWEMEDGRLEIVDGSQRLRTIEQFILGEFKLGTLESLPLMSGFRFGDLPESRQRKIRNRSIRGIVLNEHADEQARFDMFERINTGSKVANKAEVRRGALSGPFMDLVIELSKSDEFSALATVSKKAEAERELEELVIRYFAYGDGLESYRDRPSEFIFNYAKKMNSEFSHDGDLVRSYTERFMIMVQFVSDVFPNGFRKVKGGRATPRARFEAISIGSTKALLENPNLLSNPPSVDDWIASPEFAKIVGSDGANAKSRLNGRISFVHNKLIG